MRILLIGNGGREHAIAQACAQHGHEVLCTPGNPGIAQLAKLIQSPQDAPTLAALAQQEQVDLVIVGPEAYLMAGVADECQRLNIPVFGPAQAASRLEGDKAWSKAFMLRHGIPTAQHRAFDALGEALAHLSAQEISPERPIVIKDAALRAGKGVTIARSQAEAQAAAQAIFEAEPASLVIEEFMTGQEVSILALTDGTRYALTPPSQDHKTIFEGDTGPMTGGMGVICPFPVSEAQMQVIRQDIIEKTLAGLRAEGFPFCGVLYAGLMLTPEGPKVVEFNVRFGDPETQAVLVLLQSDLASHALAAAWGELDPAQVRFSGEASAVIVLAAPGYPGEPRKGLPLTVPELHEGEHLFQAGTALQGDQLVSNGGRVLAATATAPTLPEALDKAYALAERARFEGTQLRRDIGFRLKLL